MAILEFQILSERGYIVKERGLIQVKGKGEMLTFYVLGRKISRSWRFGRTVSLQGNNSLAEVVYGMVRARKRRKTTKGKTNHFCLRFFLLF
jgi:adenylate cyclase 8